ncbi:MULTISPECIES: alpha/beta fold hydrolase [unclassified Brevibacterium]|uniref:alpha/beta fold hydrolase n=1 Tax=unclassified Brevibacterium TaxID=2614124 RepID=UPI000C649E08|nr:MULTISPECIES: alpha/beta hydrolase [unclassified Brevibacterium]SMX82990.1 Pimeloyl-ACP methyl ester carboxylesterase [Brevibacterium sp. 239c]
METKDQLTITTRDGFPLAIQVSGPPEAPALLLLQGQSNSHEWWDELRSDFEPQFRTVTFDYRGTGGSRGELSELSTASFAADAAEVLAHLGITQAVVYGTSMGGRIAQMLALDFPDLISALVLGCTMLGGPKSVKRPREVGQSLARLRGREHTQYLFSLFYTPNWTVAPRYSKLLGDDTMTAEESAAHLRISAHHNAWARLPEIAAPTLIVHGDADLMNPVDNAHLLHERISGSRILICPGGRHGFFEEFAEVVNPEILGFLSASS